VYIPDHLSDDVTKSDDRDDTLYSYMRRHRSPGSGVVVFHPVHARHCAAFSMLPPSSSDILSYMRAWIIAYTNWIVVKNACRTA
jgi:hypothetical protein